MRIELPEKCGRWELRAAALSGALELASITGPPISLDDLLDAAARFEAYIAGDREQR